MIFEIAFGVALGIVLAVVVLRYWRQILASGTVLLALVLVVGLLIWVGFLAWEKRSSIAVSVMAIFLIGALYGVPFYAYGRILRALPGLTPLVRGEAPWNTLARLPLRLVAMAGFALLIAACGVGVLLGTVWVGEYVSKMWQR